MSLEWSHGKRRPTPPRPNGHDGGAPALPPAPDDGAERDVTTGRFRPGNQAHRRRMVKAKAKGIATLDPNRCDAWLAPFVRDGAAYGVELMRRVQGDPALLRLAGDVADAHTVYRALLALAAKGDMDAMREARAWLREHRSSLATLSALADESEDVDRPRGDEHLFINVDAEPAK